MSREVNASPEGEGDSTHWGWIFDIQRFSVHDGPGIRSTIFFKGCPLSCRWCGNPESQRQKPQVLYFTDLCKGCGACVEVCPRKSITVEDNSLRYDRESCDACGACTRACVYEARTLSGRRVTVEELCQAVGKDWRYYMQTGGGVTCGGGEALMQPDFLRALLTGLHDDLGYHTCLDTSGFASWKVLETLLPHLDLILLDIKHMDSAVHKKLTGVPNELILDNARRLAERAFPVRIRVPLITGENDDEENLRALGGFLRETGLREVELIPYHTYGLNKYRALGIEYPLSERPKPESDRAKSILESFGLDVRIQE